MRIPDQLIPRNTKSGRKLAARIESLDNLAFEAGIQITLKTDFTKLKRVSDGCEKLPLTPMFDPGKSVVGPANGFWMHGVDMAGETVLLQAARLYDLDDTTVALHHQSLRMFYAEPQRHAEAGEACLCEAPATHVMTGRVCYHGELWLKGGPTGYRGKGMTRIVPRLLMALVLYRWSPDYLFGMAQPGICLKGVGARYGYRNKQPHGMIWTVPSTGTLDEWVIWNTRTDLKEVVMRT